MLIPDRRPLFFLGITGDPADGLRRLDWRVRGGYPECREYLLGKLASIEKHCRGRVVPWTWIGWRPGRPYACGLWTGLIPNLRKFWREELVRWCWKRSWSIEPYTGFLLPTQARHDALDVVYTSEGEPHSPKLDDDEVGRAFVEMEFGGHTHISRLWIDLGETDLAKIERVRDFCLQHTQIAGVGAEAFPMRPDGQGGMELRKEDLSRVPFECSLKFWREWLSGKGVQFDPAVTEMHVVVESTDHTDHDELAGIHAAGAIVGCDWGCDDAVMGSVVDLAGG